uniref:Putative Carboxypeptidase S1 n=1 Tax=Ralstonia syzygii R24 TaxID=907261 RepID=G3A665_9RALS|nr:peptidase S1 [Ralstonia syzygii]CCA85943.1 putative Carboxypeptidase S1 [Ralstonia syzygii R24]
MSTQPTTVAQQDSPLVDTTVYGSGPNDALPVSDTAETAAITHHKVTINGQSLAYTATAGHLTTIDAVTSRPNAKMFYVAYTQDNPDPSKPRPVTFFYNGGPGASSVFLLLGSFGPKRIQSSFPDFTPPAPYQLLDNPDSLLDRSDLVFINPVGTGYSAAIAPAKSKDFWGVDQDARSIDRFIQRYLTKYSRWNSPKFLFGESYGTARSAVLSWVLHEDGIELNGITLQSSLLDYANALSAVGLFPTLAADAFYHKKTSVTPAPTDLESYMTTVMQYARDTLVPLEQAPNPQDSGFVNTRLDMSIPVAQQMQQYIGIDAISLIQQYGNPAAFGNFFGTLVPGIALDQYDGRATSINTGIGPFILPNTGSNDPSITNVAGVYTVEWNDYLNTTLKYTSTSSFVDLNDQVFTHWDFSHTDPTGAATPFFQTALTLESMPLEAGLLKTNIITKRYPSGHMIYLDNPSRTAMKVDLATFYDGVMANRPALMRVQSLQRPPGGPKP